MAHDRTHKVEAVLLSDGRYDVGCVDCQVDLELRPLTAAELRQVYPNAVIR
jgi:hypothetical protein